MIVVNVPVVIPSIYANVHVHYGKMKYRTGTVSKLPNDTLHLEDIITQVFLYWKEMGAPIFLVTLNLQKPQKLTVRTYIEVISYFF